MREIRVAIVGFGGIARTHYTAYCRLAERGEAIRVVAVVDRNAAQFKSTATINLGGENLSLSEDVHTYTDVDELLCAEEFDVADVCLPTFLHREYAVKLLLAGKHVLCEKPMALTEEDCRRMLLAEAESGKRLMIGQCLRFDPAYLYLKECVDSGRLGVLRYLTMARLSEYPAWSAGSWFADRDKCGGCLIDTHIHDVDMARFLLGEPREVSCVAHDNIPHCQLVNSRLFYENATVVIDGAWDEARPIPFYMGYDAKFENGSVTFDGASVKERRNGEAAVTVDLSAADRMEEELRHFVALARDPALENRVNSAESAARSVALVHLLSESAAKGGAVLKGN